MFLQLLCAGRFWLRWEKLAVVADADGCGEGVCGFFVVALCDGGGDGHLEPFSGGDPVPDPLGT